MNGCRHPAPPALLLPLQVERVVDRGTLHPRAVHLPGAIVDRVGGWFKRVWLAQRTSWLMARGAPPHPISSHSPPALPCRWWWRPPSCTGSPFVSPATTAASGGWVGGWVGGWERVGGWGLREGMHRRLARLPPARLLALPWIVCHGAVAVPLRCTCACSGEIRTPLHGIAALPMGERRLIAHR